MASPECRERSANGVKATRGEGRNGVYFIGGDEEDGIGKNFT